MTTKPTSVDRQTALQQQIKHLKHRLNDLYAQSSRYSQFRLGSFLLGMALTALSFYYLSLGPEVVVLTISLIIFGVNITLHRRIETSLMAHQIWLDIKQTHLARANLDWEKLPAPRFRTSPSDHPFAGDLDLLGARSLHHLLDTTVAQEASERLKNWLLNPKPQAEVIAQRQKIIQYLTPRSVFRDKLTLKARLSSSGDSSQWQGQKLLPWLQEKAESQSLWPLILVLAGLALLNLSLMALYGLGLIPPLWIASVAMYGGLTFTRWADVTMVFHNALVLRNGLGQLEAVFAYLEKSPHSRHPVLAPLCQAFLDEQNQPSQKLKRINFIAGAAGLANNPVLGLALNLLCPWNLYFAHHLNQAKADLAIHLPLWLEAWFELETLSALANFAYLNPTYVFPEFMGDEEVGLGAEHQPPSNSPPWGEKAAPPLPLGERGWG